MHWMLETDRQTNKQWKGFMSMGKNARQGIMYVVPSVECRNRNGGGGDAC